MFWTKNIYCCLDDLTLWRNAVEIIISWAFKPFTFIWSYTIRYHTMLSFWIFSVSNDLFTLKLCYKSIKTMILLDPNLVNPSLASSVIFSSICCDVNRASSRWLNIFSLVSGASPVSWDEASCISGKRIFDG